MLVDYKEKLLEKDNLPLYIIGDTNLVTVNPIGDKTTSSQYFVDQIKNEKIPGCTIIPENNE